MADMTDWDDAKKRRYMKYLQLKKKKAAAAVEEPETPEIEGLDYVEGLGQQITQGATLGLGDEIGSGIAALGAKGMNLITGNMPDESLGDIYESMMSSQQMKRKAFEEQNPLTSIAAQVIPAIATGGAALPQLAARAAPKVAAKLAGRGGKAVLGRVGLGAAEGGATGYAAGDIGNRGESAAMGTMLGGALPAVASGIRGARNLMSDRRIAEDLVKIDPVTGEEVFTPLSMQDPGEGLLGRALPGAYRKAVAPSAFGGGVREQAAERVLRESDKIDEADAVIKQATEEGQLAKEAHKVQIADDIQTMQTDAKIADRDFGLQTDDQIAAAKNQIDEVYGQEQRAFQQQALSGAFPTSVPQTVRMEIAGLDPQTANSRIQQLWKDEGFKEAKAQTYNLDPSVLIDDSLKGVSNAALRPYKTEVRKILNDALKGRVNRPTVDPPVPYVAVPGTTTGATKKARRRKLTSGPGQVNGTDLMQARNELKMRASMKGEDGQPALNAKALTKAADSIDDFIRHNLPDDAAKMRWDAEFEAYGQGKMHQRAVEGATRTKQGSFDGTDWIGAGQRGSRRNTGRGQAKMQADAVRLQQSASTLRPQKAEQTAGIRDTRKREMISIEDGRDRAIMQLRQSAKGGGEEFNALEAMKQQARGAKLEAETTVKQMQKRLGGTGEPALWSKRFATAALGSPLRLFGAGPVQQLIGGAAFSAGATTKTGQKILAGQTKRQIKKAADLAKYDESKRKKLLASLLRGGGGAYSMVYDN